MLQTASWQAEEMNQHTCSDLLCEKESYSFFNSSTLVVNISSGFELLPSYCSKRQWHFRGILGPSSMYVVPNSQVRLWDSKYVLFASAPRSLFTEQVRSGFRGVSEVSRNYSGFFFDNGCTPFRLQHFTRHTQRAEQWC